VSLHGCEVLLLFANRHLSVCRPKEEQPIETHSEHRNGSQPAAVYEQAPEAAPEAQAEQPAQQEEAAAPAAGEW